MYDHLNLKQQRFDGISLLVFSGHSGSGKSTAIKYLIDDHPSFCNFKTQIISGSPIDWHLVKPEAPVIVIDELTCFYDLLQTARLLVKGYKLIVASHLPLIWFYPLKVSHSLKIFQTGRDAKKIEEYLRSLNISFSSEAVKTFCNKFGATYTDIDLILEKCPSESFDQSLKKFMKLNSVHFSPIRRETSSELRH